MALRPFVRLHSSRPALSGSSQSVQQPSAAHAESGRRKLICSSMHPAVARHTTLMCLSGSAGRCSFVQPFGLAPPTRGACKLSLWRARADKEQVR